MYAVHAVENSIASKNLNCNKGNLTMFIKKLKPHVYDVFLGKGFDNWSRVRKGHWGVSVVAGNRLPKTLLRDVESHIK